MKTKLIFIFISKFLMFKACSVSLTSKLLFNGAKILTVRTLSLDGNAESKDSEPIKLSKSMHQISQAAIIPPQQDKKQQPIQTTQMQPPPQPQQQPQVILPPSHPPPPPAQQHQQQQQHPHQQQPQQTTLIHQQQQLLQQQQQQHQLTDSNIYSVPQTATIPATKKLQQQQPIIEPPKPTPVLEKIQQQHQPVPMSPIIEDTKPKPKPVQIQSQQSQPPPQIIEQQPVQPKKNPIPLVAQMPKGRQNSFFNFN